MWIKSLILIRSGKVTLQMNWHNEAYELYICIQLINIHEGYQYTRGMLTYDQLHIFDSRKAHEEKYLYIQVIQMEVSIEIQQNTIKNL